MSRLGFFTPPGRGHLYPATALGRCLAERGHEVTFFNLITTKAIIRTAGLKFWPFEIRPSYRPPCERGVRRGLSGTLEGLQFIARTVLAEAPDALRAAKIDALVIDQIEAAAGTVAELFGLPFVTLCILPPIYLDESVPPIGFRWMYDAAPGARLRNQKGNALFSRYIAPVLTIVNRQRRAWKLSELQHINEVFSNRALITQLPKAFDFPHDPYPPHLFYTGPFLDGQVRRSTRFPWEKLNGKPLIYASMGTMRDDNSHVFHIIAAACAGMDVQLVISQGGSMQDIGPLAGEPVVVPYAPQLELLKRTSVTITHAGINTTLESLANGVPLVAIPISDDQPSVAARIDWIGAGKVVAHSKLSVLRLQEAIRQVFEDPKYKAAACRMEAEIRKVKGLELAADFVEGALKV